MSNLTTRKAHIVQSVYGCSTSINIRTKLHQLPQGELFRYADSIGLGQADRKGKTAEQVSQAVEAFHLARAAQAWLCIYHSLTLDTEISTYADDDTYASQMTLWLSELDYAGLMLKYVKEATTYIAARAFLQDETNLTDLLILTDKVSKLTGQTVKPRWLLPSGWVKRLCKSWTAPDSTWGLSNEARERLFVHGQNVLYVKRGMPPALPQDIDAALRKHKDGLTSQRERDYGRACKDPPVGRMSWETADSDPTVLRTGKHEHQKRLLGYCAKVLLGEIFKPKGRTLDVDYEMSFPSANASFEASREKGGALGQLLIMTAPMDLRLYVDLGGDLDFMVEVYEAGRSSPRIVEIRKSRLRQAAIDQYRIAVTESEASRKATPVDASPSPILEPCKIRMITKGASSSYNFAMTLQKVMWGVLKRHDQFRWIGEPITQEVWDEQMDLSLLENHDGFWVSGDYSAATDNLDSWMSELVWTGIAENLRFGGKPLKETGLYELGRRCLTGHRLSYKFRKPGESWRTPPERVVSMQQWGQLMGSPMSFPILNLANAIASCVGLGWTGGSVLAFMRQHCMHTNGDDIVFFCPSKSQYELWKGVTTSIGLSLSLGKNYSSRHFAIMNSEMRLVRSFEGHLFWDYCSFVNLPILFGIEAKGPEAGQPKRLSYLELGSLSQTFCKGCPPDVAVRRAQAFNEFHKDILDRCPPGVIYEAPIDLGGLGLHRTTLTDRDLPISALQRCAWLACLGPKRFDAVAIKWPVLKNKLGRPRDFVKWILEDASPSYRFTRVVERPVDDKLRKWIHDPLTETSYVNGTAKALLGGHGMYLSEAVLKVQPYLISGTPVPYVVEETPHYDSPAIAELARIKDVEGKFSRRVWRQMSLAAKSSLEPMSLSTLYEWKSPLVLQEVEASASYRTDVLAEDAFDILFFQESDTDGTSAVDPSSAQGQDFYVRGKHVEAWPLAT